MLLYCLKCRKKIKSNNPKVARTKSGRKMLLSKCAACDSKNWKFIKQQEATQPARKIPQIFAQCSLSVAMFGTSREHLGNKLKKNIFWTVLDGKVVFVLKVYDLINKSRSNSQMPFSKMFQGYPQNIVKLWK